MSTDTLTDASCDDAGLRVSGLTVVAGQRELFTDFTLTVEPGEAVALMGPSGSGKTSLLHVITGLTTAPLGRVSIGGAEMTGKNPDQRSRLRRRRIGMAHQDADLLPELSVVDNVAVTMLFDGLPRETARQLAQATLTDLGVGALADREIWQISGGQAQRVALARALARPGISALVADEPTANLDRDSAIAVAELIRDRTEALSLTTVVATHDIAVADRCHRILRLVG